MEHGRQMARVALAAATAGLALGAGVTMATAVSYPSPDPGPSQSYPPPTDTTTTTSGTTTSTTTPSTTTTTQAGAGGSSTPTSSGSLAVLTKFNSTHGELLADGQSMSLYTLTNNGAAVACTGQCTQFWPPFEAPQGTTVTTPPGVSGVGTTTAPDGNEQVTFRGLPVYRFVGDKSPADTNGEGIQSFGGTWHLAVVTAPARLTGSPIAGVATPDGRGYWLATANGGVFTFGDAAFFGSAGNVHLAAPIVGMASMPDGRGYWLVASDGGVFTYGDAGFYGSAGGSHLAAPIIAITTTPDGRGYWLFATDGGIFTYGDAGFYGSGSR